MWLYDNRLRALHHRPWPRLLVLMLILTLLLARSVLSCTLVPPLIFLELLSYRPVLVQLWLYTLHEVLHWNWF